MSNPLQFFPFETVCDTTFWHALSKLKLEVNKLEEGPYEISGEFSNNQADHINPRVYLDSQSVSETSIKRDKKKNFYNLKGQYFCFNTRDKFIKTSKQEILDEFSKQFLSKTIESSDFLKDPSSILKFILISYCDLKNYKFTFWLAYPAFLHDSQFQILKVSKIGEIYSKKEQGNIVDVYNSWNGTFEENQIFFCYKKVEGGNVKIIHLHEWNMDDSEVILGFCDPSTSDKHPGWPLRNILSCLAYKCITKVTQIKVLCLRERYKDGSLDCDHSLFLEVEIPKLNVEDDLKFVGWEKYKQKLQPRQADLSATMDPIKLAESAVDLNLKLMHWRVLPEIDLEKIKTSKCLLLGSGTLGCNVARQLLGWGVNNITFVDNSAVSFSNPVRQTLFTFEDSKEKKSKAMAAAARLKEIFPLCNSQGHILDIPMPGHKINNSNLDASANDKLKSECQEICNKLEGLIKEHDAIFLLLDTREARWLPSLYGLIHRKLIFNGALGFDSFLAMRHGYSKEDGLSPSGSIENADDTSEGLSGYNLGCYFCNDVVGPSNSTINRSLDQQCTVSRPGASMIASSLVTELFVSVLQHPLGGGASVNPRDSILGQIPHQIRGFLSTYSLLTPSSRAFINCPSCSQPVIDAYKSQGFDFLLKVFNDSAYLEEVCGLKKLQEDSLNQDIMVYEGDDSD